MQIIVIITQIRVPIHVWSICFHTSQRISPNKENSLENNKTTNGALRGVKDRSCRLFSAFSECCTVSRYTCQCHLFDTYEKSTVIWSAEFHEIRVLNCIICRSLIPSFAQFWQLMWTAGKEKFIDATEYWLAKGWCWHSGEKSATNRLRYVAAHNRNSPIEVCCGTYQKQFNWGMLRHITETVQLRYVTAHNRNSSIEVCYDT